MLLSIEETVEPEMELIEEKPAFSSMERIGIVAGHWQDSDGHVCKDGLKEVWLNIRIATLVQQNLAGTGIQIDLLKEKDDLLTQYKGLALISIHNDTCEFIDNNATGFKIAPAMRSSYPDEVNLLLECMAENYQSVTGLTYHANETTYDMSEYHNFYEVNSSTPRDSNRNRIHESRPPDINGELRINCPGNHFRYPVFSGDKVIILQYG